MGSTTDAKVEGYCPVTGTRGGPVAPTAEATAVLSPLGHREVRLGGGWLGQWQSLTCVATLPHVLGQVEGGPAWTNLARLVGRSDAELAGMSFSDSDVYKTLEAIAWAAGIGDGVHGSLLERAGALVDLLAQVQEADGYLNSRVQGDPAVARWSDPQWGHELYTAGHLFQAAVAAERTGVLPGLLQVARRMADLLVERFGDGGAVHVEGHPEVETALVELYRLTRHRPYLQLAARQLELRGHGWLGEDRFGSSYFQDAVPVRQARSATGHAVRQLYLLTGMVDVAVETGDEQLLAAAVGVWEDLEATKTYVTGAHGSRHRDEAIGDPYELPPDRAYAESCAAIASFQLAWRLLLATGQARFAETMDVVLHNALAASTSLTGQEFFYSNPLHLRTGHAGAHEDAPSTRLAWFACACCPPNIARLLACAHDYVLSTSPEGVQVHLPTAAEAILEVEGASVHLSLTTAYPWDGRIGIAVETRSSREWELALRLPGWCERWQVGLDGEPLDPATASVRDGYLRVRRSWSGRHVVQLDLELSPRQVQAHPRVDAVRGCVAVVRGPVVYALEEADLPAGVVLEDVRLRAVREEPAPPEAVVASGSVSVVASGSVAVVADVDVQTATLDPPPLYAAQAPAVTSRALTVPLVPYHRWANRAPGAMRVWLPLPGP